MLDATSQRRFRGNSFIYMTIILVVLCGLVSLAVDLGRAQLAKTELRSAADAAARYGAAGYANNSVVANAIAVAAQNKIDGTPLVLQAQDVAQVTWNTSTGKITPGNPSPNAVQITARRTASRGTALPLVFAKIIGQPSLDITVRAVALYQAPVNVTIPVSSKGNPWLAGMPNGTDANSYDSAPANSPTQVSGITLSGGQKLSFVFSGSASHKPTAQFYGPDGDPGRMIYNCYYDGFNVGREHGKANLTAPIGCVVGVFLDSNNPTNGTKPADLDFSDPEDRDFNSLSPALKQPFFIGDGKRNDTNAIQEFIVPDGATRLFIGIMDGQQWSDNSGSMSSNVTRPMAITLVQ